MEFNYNITIVIQIIGYKNKKCMYICDKIKLFSLHYN